MVMMRLVSKYIKYMVRFVISVLVMLWFGINVVDRVIKSMLKLSLSIK